MKHEYKQSRYSFLMEPISSSEVLPIKGGVVEYLIQTETTHLKKARFDCFEDNSMYFEDCIEDFIAEELNCVLPWTKRRTKLRICQTSEDLVAFRNLSHKMTSNEIRQKIEKKKCFKPNCKKTTWVQRSNTEKWNWEKNETFFLIIIPSSTKVIQRKEVLLADSSTFLNDFSTYLGFLLGASILSLTSVIVDQIGRMSKVLLTKLNVLLGNTK